MSDEKYKRGAYIVIPTWFRVQWVGGWRWWMYGRYANGRFLYVGPVQITWDMPWSHYVPRSEGYDAGIAAMRDEVAMLKSELSLLREVELCRRD